MATGSTDREIKISVVVDANGAVKALTQLGEKTETFKTQAEGAGEGSGFFATALSSLSSPIGVVTAGLAALGGGFYALNKIIGRGDAFNDAAGAFDELNKKAGTLAGDTLNSLRIASQGTISDLQLMQLANKALTAGLDPTVFDEVVQAARRYADATGTDAVEAISKFTTTITKGSEEQLKQLGIFRDGKIQLDAVTSSTLAQSQAQLGANDALEVVSASFSNLIDGLTSTFESSELVKASTNLLASILSGLSNIVLDLGKFLIQSLDKAFKAVTTSINNFKLGLLTISELSGQLAKGEMPSLEKAIQKISKLRIDPVLDAKNWKNINGEIKKTPPILLDTAESLRKLKTESEKTAPTIKDLVDYLNRLPDEVRALDEAEQSGIISTEQLSIGLDELIKDGTKLGGTFQQVTDAMSAGFERVKKPVDNLSNSIGGLDDSTGILQEILGTLQSESSGGGIGGLFSDLLTGDASDKQKVSDLVSNLTSEGIKAFGATLGPAGAIIGQIVGDAIGKIVGKAAGRAFDHIFGDSEATKERKKLDAYFDNLFNANRISVVVNGQLKRLKELTTASSSFGDPNKGFFDDFNKLSGAAKDAFRAVGIAFGELNGVAASVASSFGAVFATNIGASLNNLQLLVEASGVSFEELGSQIENAFLKGELSITQARLALIGLEKTAQKGIPDAVGAADTAFQNLLDAGLNGGRASVDALRDIVYEAKELGITNFAELRKFIRESGDFSGKEIKALFGALKDIGVSNFDQLTSASLSTIIAVLTQFNSRGGFDEATAKLEDTATAINNVPAEKKVKFIIDVDYTDRAKSTTAQAALANINAPTVKRAEGVR